MTYALSIGVDIDSFWHLTPHSLSLIAQGYEIAYKRQIESNNAMAYLQGAYVRDALLSTVGNMLSDKRSQKNKYPEQPYDLDLDGRKEERDKEKQLELFVASLTAKMNNFNLQKSKQG